MDETELYNNYIMAIPKLTPLQYRTITKHMKLSSDLHRRAHAVLVDGKSIKFVSEEAGVSEEAIRKLCRRIVGELRPALPQLPEETFEKAHQQLNLSDENILRARRVLVDGEPLTAVANDTSVTAGVLSRVIWRILDAAIPPGWRRVCVTVPDNIATEIEDLELQAKDTHRSNR